MNCPCCGAEMHTPGLAALRHVSLPPNERRVLNELINVYPSHLSVRQLVDRVWALDPNGGPDTADNAISVYLHRMRPILLEFGWSISRMPGRKSGVFLRKVEDAPKREAKHWATSNQAGQSL